MSISKLTSDTADTNLLHPDYYLPSEVIDSILVCLPIKDAVRTSVLSSKWMLKWHSMSKLVFDSKCLQSLSNKDGVVELNKLANIIDVVLSLHVGPIQSFELSVALPKSHDISRWIIILWRNHIKKLILKFTDGEHCIESSLLFNCAKLTHLELHNCQLTPSSCFCKLINLEHLVLSEVGGPSGILKSLICSSPLLKYLSLDEVECLTDLDIQALNLEEISIDSNYGVINIVAAPRLTKLCIDLQFLFGGDLKLDRLPSTYHCMKEFTVNIDFCHKEEFMTLVSLLKSFPNLKALQIRGYSFGSRSAWEFGDENLTFNHLQVVKMSDMIGLPQELHLIKNILANSPVLKTVMLNIDAEQEEFTDESNIFMELLQYPRASSVAEILILRTSFF